MLTHSGIHITQDFGAPSIRDIAVQSMRLVRFSGAGEVFWPIGMHMLLVADLMPRCLPPPEGWRPTRPGQMPPGVTALDYDEIGRPRANPWLVVYGQLHDAAEIVMGDIPRPMKSPEQRSLEDRVQYRIYNMLGVPQPNPEILEAVKRADFRAALTEGAHRCGGPGFEETQTGYRPDPEADALLERYLRLFEHPACIFNPNNVWALWYETRLRNRLREAQSISYAMCAEERLGKNSACRPRSWNTDHIFQGRPCGG
jgi:hypothetical protein